MPIGRLETVAHAGRHRILIIVDPLGRRLTDGKKAKGSPKHRWVQDCQKDA